jgi:methyltransferase (TIGR00027 family)
MEQHQPSRTAQGAAMHRAAHQLLDRPPVFADPLALSIVGAEAEVELRAGRDWPGAGRPGLRAFLAVRSRFTEDSLAAAVGRGIGQYVLLGAGLDTFAYRAGQGFAGLSVFEIDHPSTQAWKRSRLAEAGIAVPASVVYAPVDFEAETLAEGLARGGFDNSRAAFFAWLGVTPYLEPETVMATLRYIVETMRPGSEIVFDYAEPVANLDPTQRAGLEALAARVATLGEPFRCFFEPAPLAHALRQMGFSDVEDLDTAALNARYFLNRADGLKLTGRAHMLKARV